MSITVDREKIRILRDEINEFCKKLHKKYGYNMAELFLAMQAVLMDGYRRWEIAKVLGIA